MLGEYDAGYENYIDSMIREIEKLQDENDKLSEQVSSLVGRSFRTADKMSCIEDDNAKLRELVADVHEALCSDKAGMFHKLILASMEDDMRELGVEVDDGLR